MFLLKRQCAGFSFRWIFLAISNWNTTPRPFKVVSSKYPKWSIINVWGQIKRYTLVVFSEQRRGSHLYTPVCSGKGLLMRNPWQHALETPIENIVWSLEAVFSEQRTRCRQTKSPNGEIVSTGCLESNNALLSGGLYSYMCDTDTHMSSTKAQNNKDFKMFRRDSPHRNFKGRGNGSIFCPISENEIVTFILKGRDALSSRSLALRLKTTLTSISTK